MSDSWRLAPQELAFQLHMCKTLEELKRDIIPFLGSMRIHMSDSPFRGVPASHLEKCDELHSFILALEPEGADSDMIRELVDQASELLVQDCLPLYNRPTLIISDEPRDENRPKLSWRGRDYHVENKAYDFQMVDPVTSAIHKCLSGIQYLHQSRYQFIGKLLKNNQFASTVWGRSPLAFTLWEKNLEAVLRMFFQLEPEFAMIERTYEEAMGKVEPGSEQQKTLENDLETIRDEYNFALQQARAVGPIQVTIQSHFLQLSTANPLKFHRTWDEFIGSPELAELSSLRDRCFIKLTQEAVFAYLGESERILANHYYEEVVLTGGSEHRKREHMERLHELESKIHAILLFDELDV